MHDVLIGKGDSIERRQDTTILVIIGNPPYNVGQVNENDNNKNRTYPALEQSIRETYAKDSAASNRNALSDVYVKFFRWATDRLGERDGILCFVTNNGFLHGIAFDGFRKHLAQDFTHIYHLDLGGNARKGGGGSVFGIMVGVGITLLVRKRHISATPAPTIISYHAVDDGCSGKEKLTRVHKLGNTRAVKWETLQPDERQTWLQHGLRPEFETFLPLGTKAAKMANHGNVAVIFKGYSLGVSTNRDPWAYNYQREMLILNIRRFIACYNREVDRWKHERNQQNSVDDFVIYDDTKIKWSRDLKLDMQREKYAMFEDWKVRTSIYRPFCKQYLFYDRILNEEVRHFHHIFPTPATERENVSICVTGVGAERPFTCLATNVIPNSVFTGGFGCVTQCFPFYIYKANGTNRTENITDWALEQFQAVCGVHISKWDIFSYVYAILHHPTYRMRYAKNLKRDLPRIPLPSDAEAFTTLAMHGKALVDLHVHYERVPKYILTERRTKHDDTEWWRVEQMKLSRDRTHIIVNPVLTLDGIPPQCFDYQLGNRSALEWVIDQYQVKTDKRSGIVNDPNREDERDYIVNLVQRVVYVSVETVKIVGEIADVNLELESDAVYGNS